MYYLPYNIDLKTFSRRLRTNSTLGEVLLWNQIKQGKISGYTFYRQKPIDRYIVDFYCRQLNLVIEIDGSVHQEDAILLNDIERQAVLEKHDLHFLRFDDALVRRNMDKVLNEINDWVLNKTGGEVYIRKRKNPYET